MDSFDPMNPIRKTMINPCFKPLNDGWGFQPINSSMSDASMFKGDIHDAFKVNSFGNISGDHTTIQLSGYKPKRIP